MKQWIDKLRQERTLTPEEFRQLLTGCDAEILRYINKQAQEVALLHFGNKIYIRGLIEISNCCRNNCYYCGIRKGNPNIERYRLSRPAMFSGFERDRLSDRNRNYGRQSGTNSRAYH